MAQPRSMQRISAGMLVTSGGTLVSRVTGLVRDIVLARMWGTGDALAGFFIAFTIPNLLRRLFGEGALAEAGVPVFNERLTRDGRRAAFELVAMVLSVYGTVLVALVGVVGAGAVLVRPWLPPGIAQDVAELLPWLMPYAVFICLAGFLAGIAQSLGHFAVPAYAPVILNVMFVLAATVVCPRLGDDPERQVKGLAAAVLVAGVLQLALFVPVLRRRGFRFRFRPDFRARPVREVTWLMAPLVFGASVNQLNVLCDRLIAGWLGGYAVTSLYYSERLVYLPVGVFGVALSAAALPVLSRAVSRGQSSDVIEALCYGLRHLMFLALPCVVALLLLGLPIVRLIFQRGSFTADSAAQTSAALLFYAPGIPAFCAVKLVRAGFISHKDTRTPVLVGAACLVLNVVLNLALMGPLQQRGLALATCICSYVNVLLLLWLLARRLQPEPQALRALGAAVTRLLAAGLACAAAIAAMCTLKIPVSGFGGRLLQVLPPLAAGAVAYLAVALVMGAAEPRELWSLLRDRFARRS